MKNILMIGTGGTIASEMTPEGLTPEETAERAALRQEYLNSVMGNLRRELDNTWIVDEHGNKRKLTPGKKTMS